MTDCRCPTCGQGVKRDLGIVVDMASNTVSFRGRIVKLTGREADFMTVLHEAMPRAVTREHLLQRTYCHAVDAPCEKIVDVYVCHLRPKIAAIGLAIVNVWGRGFKLEEAEGPLPMADLESAVPDGGLGVTLSQNLLRIGGDVYRTAPLRARVLACLVEASPSPVSLAEIVAKVWPGETPNARRTVLGVHISELRSRLARSGGAYRILRDPSGYSLVPVEPAEIALGRPQFSTRKFVVEELH